jgi:hypothetical protein
MTDKFVYINSDNVIKLAGLADDTGAYINDATVVVTLVNDSDAEVTGETWPLTMNYVAASNGDYKATLSDALVLTNPGDYHAIVDADGGAGKRYYRKIPVIAKIGTS